jgi:hypothetical protein
MAKRFSETVNIQQVDTRTGVTQAASSLSDRLGQFSSQLAQKTAAVSQQRSAERGAVSGGGVQLRDEQGQLTTPEFKEKPQFIGGIEVAAHNKALRARYLAELNNDNRESVSEIVANNPDNLLNFNDSANGFRDGVLKGLEFSVRGPVSEDLDNLIRSARMQVQRADIQKQRRENIEVLSASGEGSFDSASSLMRRGEGLAAGEAMLEGIKVVDAMVEADYITESQGQARKDDANRDLAEQSFKGAMDSVYETDGISGVNSWLTKHEGKPPRGFDADQWDSVTDQIQVDANRKESRKKAKVTRVSNEAKESLRQYKLAKSLGFEVSAQDEAALNMAIAGTDLVIPKKIIDATAIFSVLPKTDRKAVLKTAQTGSLDDVDMFASIAKADKEINKLAAEDGYSLGIKQGIIEAEPLDLSDPELFTGRVALSKMLSTHYGVDVSPLSDGEATNLSASIPNMTPAEKIELANTLVAAPAVWGQLDKKNAGQFAMAAATGDAEAMTAIFNGQELLKAGLVKPLKHEEFNLTFNEYVGAVYGTQDKKATLDAVKSHYAATSSNAADGIYDDDDFKASLAAVTGGVEVISGSFFGASSRVELPRGVDGDIFEDYIEDFGPDLVEHFGGVANYSNEQAADVIQEGQIVSVGSNKYGVRIGETLLFNHSGEPFLFSYDADLSIDSKAEQIKQKEAELIRPRRSVREIRGK